MANSLESPHFASSDSSSSTARWHWRLEDASGIEVNSEHAGTQNFPSQGDAESWVGELWAELLDDGVEQVTLLEDDREVYGPMGLRPSP